MLAFLIATKIKIFDHPVVSSILNLANNALHSAQFSAYVLACVLFSNSSSLWNVCFVSSLDMTVNFVQWHTSIIVLFDYRCDFDHES